jgi:PAS domain S-box-containing protein
MSDLRAAILDSLASGILAVDAGNRIVFLNRSLLQRLGIQPQDWVGRPLAELIQKVAGHFANAAMTHWYVEWLQKPDAWRSAEIEWREADHTRHLREDSGPLRDASGRIMGRLFAFHDISGEKEIDRMKSEFIAVASHELRTPMTSIKGSVDLVLSGFAGEISTETQELLEIAKKSCDRLIRLINDILDLSKIEARQIKLRLAQMDVTEAAERSIRSVKPLADQGEVILALQRSEVLPLVEADKDRIEQVVTNLLSNAIKFSPPKGTVRVRLSAVETWVECTVSDEGCGIAPEDLPRIFGKFQQVGDSRQKGGTGLGLAIAQALVHEHKGKIWVESELNKGTHFTFRLPAIAGSPAGQ